MKTAFERIMTVHVPLWASRFNEKSRDYRNETTGWEPHTFLGVRGQFADIWRKIGKLKKALWDGEELTGEQPIEIIDDLIAHLFLTRDLLTGKIPEPGTFREPVDAPALRAQILPQSVIAMARRAVDGNPEELESKGFLILDRNPGLGDDHCPTSGHAFDRDCAYKIARRRML